jgi:ParB family chromosome partitioning protein
LSVRRNAPTAGAEASVERGTILTVPLEAITVDPASNPRRRFVDIEGLAASIRGHGLLQPLVVRRDPDHAGRYRLVAGHRRLAALQLLAERHPRTVQAPVSVVLRDENAEEAYLLTLIENLQREELSPREEAEALGRLVRERHWSTRQVAAAIHRSQPYVSRRLRVYDDKVLRPLVLGNQLPISVAEELLAADPERRSDLARRAAREQWDQKHARAEARGYTAAFHPQLQVQIRQIREVVASATLSVGERQLLLQFGQFLLSQVQPVECTPRANRPS